MSIDFGCTSKGEIASLYWLENENGMKISVTNYGATLVKLLVPDKDGELVNTVLGYDDVKGYEKGGCSFGATVGRVANRIGGGAFDLNGTHYELEHNDGQNCLHGGRDFYNKRLWKTESEEVNKVVFSLFSPDGDQGFPGNLKIQVSYELTEKNEVKIHHHAVSDADTVINLTNHSYFNLAKSNMQSVEDQEAWIDADAFTISDAAAVPTGEIVSIAQTPMDFREYKKLGKDIDADYEPLILGHGYDHNYVLNGEGLRKVAGLRCEETGISMEVFTDLPGVQLYTANYLDSEPGYEGEVYESRYAVCFETQYYPDAIHKGHFPSPILKADEEYDTTTIYKF